MRPSAGTATSASPGSKPAHGPSGYEPFYNQQGEGQAGEQLEAFNGASLSASQRWSVPVVAPQQPLWPAATLKGSIAA